MASHDNVVHYELLGELAHGGMATVYLGRAKALKQARLVAIKSIRYELAEDKTFAQMFVDEATLTMQIRHPNVVQTLDLASEEGKLLLVMEYVEGVAVSRLLELGQQKRATLPPKVAVALLCDVLRGLHHAHELADPTGRPLSVVHRDVSPPNIIVGVDGITRIIDFGVAKAASQVHVTVRGEIKGKLAYMPPEQAKGDAVDRRADIWSAGVVLWEALIGRRLFNGRTEAELIKQIFDARVDPPSMVADEEIPGRVDQVVIRALAANRDERWPTAAQMADALAAALAPATHGEVAGWLQSFAGAEIAERQATIQRFEATPLEGEAQTLQTFLTSRALKKEQLRQVQSAQPAVPEARPTLTREEKRELRRKRRQMRTLIGFLIAIIVILLLSAIALVVGQKMHGPR